MSSGLSKYAIKIALRRRDDGGAIHPMPRPFSWEYHPSYECPVRSERFDLGKLLPHEKPELISKFRIKFAFV